MLISVRFSTRIVLNDVDGMRSFVRFLKHSLTKIKHVVITPLAVFFVSFFSRFVVLRLPTRSRHHDDGILRLFAQVTGLLLRFVSPVLPTKAEP